MIGNPNNQLNQLFFKLMNINKQFLWAGLLALLLMTSCSSKKDFIYLADMKVGNKYPIESKYEPVIHSDDLLSITVSCKNPELAIPFNIYGGSFKVGTDGNVTADVSSSAKEKGYRVDVDGNIDFPILGKLHIEGMTVSAVKQLICDLIVAGNYMKDPLVSIEFLNFKYTVLGAVNGNGTYSSKGDRVTLLDAIANAGDLNAKARIDRVAVIREIDGERQIFMHDLNNTEIFKSPCFYLQQNDIVYVEPKYRKKDNEDRGWQIATMLVSITSVVCSVLWVIK